MATQHPYEALLEQIAELLRLANSCARLPLDENRITPDIEKRLKNLENKMKQFEMVTEAIITDIGGEQETALEELKANMEKLPEREQEFFKRLDKLKDQAEKGAEGKGAVQARKARSGYEVANRKAKFKKQGGDSKWKPI